MLALSIEMVSAGNCWSCGVPVYIPRAKYDACQSDAEKNFFCCNGHSACFRENKATRLQKELDAAQVRIKAEIAKREMAERSANAHKGKVTEIKNRIHNGVCPCCKRSFQNLRRHMSTKHPDFQELSK